MGTVDSAVAAGGGCAAAVLCHVQHAAAAGPCAARASRASRLAASWLLASMPAPVMGCQSCICSPENRMPMSRLASNTVLRLRGKRWMGPVMSRAAATQRPCRCPPPTAASFALAHCHTAVTQQSQSKGQRQHAHPRHSRVLCCLVAGRLSHQPLLIRERHLKEAGRRWVLRSRPAAVNAMHKRARASHHARSALAAAAAPARSAANTNETKCKRRKQQGTRWKGSCGCRCRFR